MENKTIPALDLADLPMFDEVDARTNHINNTIREAIDLRAKRKEMAKHKVEKVERCVW